MWFDWLNSGMALCSDVIFPLNQHPQYITQAFCCIFEVHEGLLSTEDWFYFSVFMRDLGVISKSWNVLLAWMSDPDLSLKFNSSKNPNTQKPDCTEWLISATLCLFTSPHMVYMPCHFDRTTMVGCKCLCMEQGPCLCVCCNVHYACFHKGAVIYMCTLHVSARVKCVFPWVLLCKIHCMYTCVCSVWLIPCVPCWDLKGVPAAGTAASFVRAASLLPRSLHSFPVNWTSKYTVYR